MGIKHLRLAVALAIGIGIGVVVSPLTGLGPAQAAKMKTYLCLGDYFLAGAAHGIRIYNPGGKDVDVTETMIDGDGAPLVEPVTFTVGAGETKRRNNPPGVSVTKLVANGKLLVDGTLSYDAGTPDTAVAYQMKCT